MDGLALPNRVTSHRFLRAYLSLPLLWFVVATSMISFLAPCLIAAVTLHIMDALDSAPTHLADQQSPFSLPTFAESVKLLGLSIFTAPIIETMIFHWKSLLLLMRFTRSDAAAIAISAILFGLFHLRSSLMSCLMVLFPGCVMAFAFVLWYRKTNSTNQGFSAACGVHILHNFYNYLLTFVPASVLF